MTRVLTDATGHRVALHAIRTGAVEAALAVSTQRRLATWRWRFQALVDVGALEPRVPVEALGTLAPVAARLVDAEGPSSAGSLVVALVHVDALAKNNRLVERIERQKRVKKRLKKRVVANLLEGVTGVAGRTGAGVVARGVEAAGSWTAGVGAQGALVDVLAVLFAVAVVAGLALAQEVGGQVAALGILHASCRERRVVALVDVCEANIAQNLSIYTDTETVVDIMRVAPRESWLVTYGPFFTPWLLRASSSALFLFSLILFFQVVFLLRDLPSQWKPSPRYPG